LLTSKSGTIRKYMFYRCACTRTWQMVFGDLIKNTTNSAEWEWMRNWKYL